MLYPDRGPVKFLTGQTGEIMGLKTTCSNCGASFAMKSRDMEGKKVKCKKCGEPFVVEFESGSGGGGMPAMGGLPPKVVGQRAPRQVKPASAEDEPASTASQGGSGSKKIFIIGGSVVGLLVVWTGVMVAIGSGGGDNKPDAPKTVELPLQRGKSTQGRFGVDYPVGWEFKAAGGSGGAPESILIKGDDVTISVRIDPGGSAVGDIVSAGGTAPDEQPLEELEPIAKLHEFMKGELVSEMNSYEEEPPEKIMTKAGNSRLSKFVGDRGYLGGGKAFGYRATVPGGTDKLKVKIICDSQQVFDKYDPMLRKIVLSIGPP